MGCLNSTTRDEHRATEPCAPDPLSPHPLMAVGPQATGTFSPAGTSGSNPSSPAGLKRSHSPMLPSPRLQSSFCREGMRDATCLIYSYLMPQSQFALRATSREFRRRFNQAAEFHRFVAASVTEHEPSELPSLSTLDDVIHGDRSWIPINLCHLPNISKRQVTLILNIDLLDVCTMSFLQVINGFLEDQWFVRFLAIFGSRKELVAIANDFGHLQSRKVSSCLRAVDFDGLRSVNHIGSHFLANAQMLKAVDLKPFSSVRRIDSHFLAGCCNLTSLDLTQLSELKVGCGDNFLEDCKQIQELDLAMFCGVKKIGSGFLSGCTGLQRVTCSLPRMSRFVEEEDETSQRDQANNISLSVDPTLEAIPPLFMIHCTSLKSIDWTPFKNVKTIGSRFLAYSSGIELLSFGPLAGKVESIDDLFLLRCTSLVRLDLSALSQGAISKIRNGFCCGCESLQAVTFGKVFCSVTIIGSEFFKYCRSLKTLDLSWASNVTSIGNHFLHGASGLLSLDISALTKVQKAPVGFLDDCGTLIVNPDGSPADGSQLKAPFHPPIFAALNATAEKAQERAKERDALSSSAGSPLMDRTGSSQGEVVVEKVDLGMWMYGSAGSFRPGAVRPASM